MSAEVTLFPHFTNIFISDNPMGLRATDEEVGEAIAYEAGLSFATIPPQGAPHAAPGCRDYMSISTINSTSTIIFEPFEGSLPYY